MAAGARLKFAVSLRSRFVLVITSAVLALSLAGCARETGFQERNLPADLPRYLRQLKALKVPTEVESLAWIPTTLRELDASGTEVTVIPFVPMSMERLDLHAATKLKQLPTLPASIRELDIRSTQLDGPWRFPSELESLALGGERVETLEGLRGVQLLELTLENVPNLRSTAGLPESLQIISISGATLSQLIELPPQLKELRLENTQVRTLKGLPESLQSMTLIENGVIEAELPRTLVSLTLNGARQRLTPLEKLIFVNQLDIRHEAGLATFHAFLRHLYVPVLRQEIAVSRKLRRKVVLPLGLRRLEFDGVETDIRGRPLLPRFPSSLEELVWNGGSDLTKLPLGLKHLAIPSSSLSDLSGLPSGVKLESLDVSLTGIGIAKLPNGLVKLRYRFCRFDRIFGLPSNLRELDLKGSVSVRILQALPPKLERLNVSATSVAELPVLPDALTELDISNTPIDDLQGLRGLRRLRRLTVHAGQLQSLVGLPASVDELRFVGRL